MSRRICQNGPAMAGLAVMEAVRKRRLERQLSEAA
jgi:hypothetical protein